MLQGLKANKEMIKNNNYPFDELSNIQTEKSIDKYIQVCKNFSKKISLSLKNAIVQKNNPSPTIYLDCFLFCKILNLG